jgi:hypothetical protein
VPGAAPASDAVAPPAPGPVPSADGSAPGPAGAEGDLRPEAAVPPADAVPAVDGGAAPDAAPAPGTSGLEQTLAAAPTSDPRAAAVPMAAAPAAPPALPPHAQVAHLLGPVLEGPDGAYSLSLQLYPEELGAVQVDVLLHGSELRLALHAVDPAAQSALKAALPDLRADLQSTGLTATSVSVDGGRSGQPGSDQAPSDRSPRSPALPLSSGSGAGSPTPSVRPAPSSSDAALDLRM